ncbi:MAG: N-acetylneuraminate synthase family protein [Oceanospirillaceae bacterium]|nr:N-acetylneuraminate synthase family protein [Oceanospirillaceae bacterium]
MLISRKISDFLVFETESIFKALEKLNSNKHRVVFILSEGGVLEGSLSDGDFRRWLTSTPDFDLQREVREVMFAGVRFESIDAHADAIESCFSGAIEIVPLVDLSKRLVAVAFKSRDGLTIDGRLISPKSPAYIIAEIGNNHNGSLARAKLLVDHAKQAGADCAKFQMRHMSALYVSGAKSDHSADLGAQYTHDILSKFQLNDLEMYEVFDYCRSKGITPLCTPWDLESLAVLEEYGMPAYKVASADLTNHQLINALIDTGKPLICSTGMSTEIEIRDTVRLLRRRGANFVLLHCNSTYPTPYKDVNLSYIERLTELAGSFVGYSGHERGVEVPVAAVALGAKVIEKHLTIDRELEGNDHKVSLLPEELEMMVSMIRNVEVSLGRVKNREISQGELINRENLAKSLVAKVFIKKGETITAEKITVRSPGQGLQPIYSEHLIGRTSHRDIDCGGFFYESDMNDIPILPRAYSFTRPFGIPVRLHDYQALVQCSNFDFVEFHPSYNDLSLELSKYIKTPQEIGFAVHAPELFEGDHILDLASDSDVYRARSIAEMNRVCDVTRALKAYFPKTSKPLVIVNAGGFTNNGFIEDSAYRATLYKRISESLKEVNEEGVEIVIQSMPPFPWHFGGQSYHNLFVSAPETLSFCRAHNRRICLDISHTMMACNHYGWSLKDFIEAIGDYVAHLHIVDAIGVDGEGIQIGKGDVNFTMLKNVLSKECPDIPFIPEVWQGHKNKGEGFWSALEFLEEYF